MKKIEQQIVKFIQNQVKEANAKGIVIGLSGGIDSAVVAVLAIKALEKNNVLGLIMPCESDKRDKKDAMLLCEKFGINYEIIDLTYPYITMNHRFPSRLLDKLNISKSPDTANLKVRLRMCMLYFVANTLNYLVCGTGNKSEILVGYFTKWGDGGVDFEPIGDLYKREVIALAEHLEIPKKIINKTPTAGLWKGQTDEDEMEITYKRLDYILSNPSFLKQKNLEFVADAKKVKKMIQSSEHKRHLPEICKIER